MSGGPTRRWGAALTVGLAVVGVAAAGGVLHRNPPPMAEARAQVRGGPLAPDLEGRVDFQRTPSGTVVTVRVRGLPAFRAGEPPVGPHGFHIHEVGNCEVGDPRRPFQAAGPHWNPDEQPHGNHAGDFPVLFSHGGRAWMSFFTNRFRPEDVVGRSVIIHLNPDDYRTQPDGASGPRIACGVIEAVVPPADAR